MAKRVSIINFKGGVGKTTLAFNFGAGLARYHKAKVLLVDMDHQSSLSIVALRVAAWDEAVTEQRTTDEIFKPFIGQRPDTPGRELVISSPVRGSNYSALDLVPASLQLDDTEIELTASHHGNAIQSEWQKRTLVCDWLDKAKIDKDYDYIIFDCPPATKIVSQNAIAASHGVIIPVVPEAVMERGAPHLFAMIDSGIDKRLRALQAMGTKKKSFVRKTKLVGLVITRIATHSGYSGYTNDHTRHLRSLQRTWSSDLLEPYIVQGVGVSESLAAGRPVYDGWNTQNVGGRDLHTQYRKITENLKVRVDAL